MLGLCQQRQGVALGMQLFDAVLGQHAAVLEGALNQQGQIVVVHVDGLVQGAVEPVKAQQIVAFLPQVFFQGFMRHVQAELDTGGGIPVAVNLGRALEGQVKPVTVYPLHAPGLPGWPRKCLQGLQVLGFVAFHGHGHGQNQAIGQGRAGPHHPVKQKPRQPPVAVHERVGKHKCKTHQRPQHQWVHRGAARRVGQRHDGVHDGGQRIGWRGNVGHAQGSARRAAQPVLGMPEFVSPVQRVGHGQVLQVNQVVLGHGLGLMCPCQQGGKRLCLARLRAFALDVVGAFGFAQVGPAHRPVQHGWVQVGHKRLGGTQNVFVQPGLQCRGSAHAGAVVRVADAIEIHPPPAAAPGWAGHKLGRIKQRDVAALCGRRVGQLLAVCQLPQVANLAQVGTAGAVCKCGGHRAGGYVFQGQDGGLQVQPFMLEGKQQMGQRVVGGRGHLGGHLQAVAGCHHLGHRGHHRHAVGLKRPGGQVCAQKFVSNRLGTHVCSLSDQIFFRKPDY